MADRPSRSVAEPLAPASGVGRALWSAGAVERSARGSLRVRPVITRSRVQIALGAIWLLDGLLQFQSYMYGHAFVSQVLEAGAQGQPSVIGGPILALAHFYGRDQVLWNTTAGLLQCAIGVGLLLGGRALRPALLVSFGWALAVWWFGEGLGMVFTGTPVSPLMGAPGAALLYGLLGLLVWPSRHDRGRSVADGSPLGDRGGRLIWSLLWLAAAAQWLLAENRAANAIHDQLAEMAGASPHLLAGWQRAVASATLGHGGTVAAALALISAGIAAGVWTRRGRVFALLAGALLASAYWVLGQSVGGPFWAGTATDVNTGPLFVLLAIALMPLRTPPGRASQERAAGGSRQPACFRPGSRARAGLGALVPVLLFGSLLLAFPTLFTGSAATPTASGATAGPGMIGMEMSATGPVRTASGGACTVSRCPIPRPGPQDLSVAGELGRALAAIWVEPARAGLLVRLELLNENMGPVTGPVTIAGSSSRRSCGPGCWTFELPTGTAGVVIASEQGGRRYALRLPVRWERGQSAVARRLLGQAVASMRSLSGVRDVETLTSGPPGETERFDYRLGAPNRMAYALNTGARVVVIGAEQWSSTPAGGWKKSVYGGGDNGGFKISSWYDWGQYDQSAQLLDERDRAGQTIADIALMSPSLPVWFRLHIDVSSGQVADVSMTAGGHFMTDRYSQYGSHQRIAPPPAG